MIESLKFVQGAVAKKDFVQELTHYHIENGLIKAFNGMLGLCCPIDLNLDVKPNATQFFKAIQSCKETATLHLTDAGRLAIKSGPFRAFVDCIPGDFPEVLPKGRKIPLDGGLLAVIKALAPFIAEDASRQWARGILLRGQSAYVTNNIILIQKWLGYQFPIDLNIPRAAVAELLRIGEEPTSLQVGENNVTFHFPGNRWLRTQTYDLSWPDVDRILSVDGDFKAAPQALWDSTEELVHFVDDQGRLFLSPGKVSTSQNEGEGASVDIPELEHAGCFHFKQLYLVSKIADKIDLSKYPKPCPFIGKDLRGVIIGMKVL